MKKILSAPPLESDAASILEIFNSNFANKIVTAATTHLNLFDKIPSVGISFDELRARLELEVRSANVLVTALLSLGLLKRCGKDGSIFLTKTSELFLRTDSQLNVIDYLELAHEASGVNMLVDCLRNNAPVSSKYIKTKGIESVMDDKTQAEMLTECLAGRAINSAPTLAAKCPLANARLLLDIGGGTGIFAIAYLQNHPELEAIVVDLPHVVDVAKKYAIEFGVADRLRCESLDMFSEDLPKQADAILLSNVLHDWGIDSCHSLISRCHDSLVNGGTLIVHDVLLDDDLSGPENIAIYSVVLFFLTEGRAYSNAEYKSWLQNAGFDVSAPIATNSHCSFLKATKIG